MCYVSSEVNVQELSPSVAQYTMCRPKHRNKPWRSDSLKLLWNEVRKCENEWHKSDDGNKPRLKANLRQVQKHFDREVQKLKGNTGFQKKENLRIVVAMIQIISGKP